jgi:2-desacetyl-2-hydroxyethyl bacteriochlorophyllide A dehydrogenase
MKAMLVREPNRYELSDVPVPRIASGEALVRVEACGICGTDIDIIEGNRPMEVTAYPVILGHEFSGEVVEVGSEVKEVRPGDKVAVDTVIRCSGCRNCAMGWTAHCLTAYNQIGCTIPGGMAEYVAVPQRQLYKLPDSLHVVDAALAEPGSCAAHGVSKADIRPGDSVVVIGVGPIGALTLQFGRLFSPAHLISVEIDDRKLELARKLGATHAVSARHQDVTTAIMDITHGLGADAIIECSGSLDSIQKTFSYVGTKGRIVVIGVPSERKFEIDFLSLLLRDALFRPSNGYTTQIWLWVLQLLSSGAIDTRTIVTHRFPLSQIDKAFSMLRTREECAIKVLTSPQWREQ